MQIGSKFSNLKISKKSFITNNLWNYFSGKQSIRFKRAVPLLKESKLFKKYMPIIIEEATISKKDEKKIENILTKSKRSVIDLNIERNVLKIRENEFIFFKNHLDSRKLKWDHVPIPFHTDLQTWSGVLIKGDEKTEVAIERHMFPFERAAKLNLQRYEEIGTVLFFEKNCVSSLPESAYLNKKSLTPILVSEKGIISTRPLEYGTLVDFLFKKNDFKDFLTIISNVAEGLEALHMGHIINDIYENFSHSCLSKHTILIYRSPGKGISAKLGNLEKVKLYGDHSGDIVSLGNMVRDIISRNCFSSDTVNERDHIYEVVKLTEAMVNPEESLRPEAHEIVARVNDIIKQLLKQRVMSWNSRTFHCECLKKKSSKLREEEIQQPSENSELEHNYESVDVGGEDE